MGRFMQTLFRARKENENKELVQRVHILDTVRGFALVNMILYHLAYDVVVIFNTDWPWFYSPAAIYWQQFICWSFILSSGASANLSRHVLKRGLKVLGCGLIITFVTCVFMPEQAIPFGILSFLGFSMIITYLLMPNFNAINPVLGTVGSFLLFAIFRAFPWGYVGFLRIKLFKLPEILYSTKFLFFIGLPHRTYPLVDYFPLIPWIFLFWTGFFGFRLLKGYGFKRLLNLKIPMLSSLGRNTLIVYMLHQPILYGITYLIFA